MANQMIIRGERILEQMMAEPLTEESSYRDLEQKTLQFQPATKKRQFAVDPIQIVEMKLVPYRQSQTLDAHATATSDGKKYQPSISFSDVAFSPIGTCSCDLNSAISGSNLTLKLVEICFNPRYSNLLILSDKSVLISFHSLIR